MRYCRVLEELVTLIEDLDRDLYSKSMSAVRIEGELTEWFRIKVEARLGCELSPDLFNLILEIVMRLAEKEGSGTGVKLNGRLLDNLRYADDIYLLADMKESLHDLTNRVDKSSKRMGLKINAEKQKRWQ